MNWLKRDLTVYIEGRSPAGMAAEYAGVFVDGFGNAASNVDWIADPDITAVAGWHIRYWKLTGEVVSLMSQAERDAVDADALADFVTDSRTSSIAFIDAVSDTIAWVTRALVETFNKRDNYIINRIVELQDALTAVKNSSGPADNIRAAIPASWLATNTRTKPQAIAEYKDNVTAGTGDP